jgi:UDP-N-acetylmuramoyl-L-alanyl-D-glutamate--2,6-diaminopimelate ligase
VAVIRDRALAIAEAIGSADEGDTVLVAGKGHEDYQLVGEARLPFSDRDTVRQMLGEAA